MVDIHPNPSLQQLILVTHRCAASEASREAIYPHQEFTTTFPSLTDRKCSICWKFQLKISLWGNVASVGQRKETPKGYLLFCPTSSSGQQPCRLVFAQPAEFRPRESAWEPKGSSFALQLKPQFVWKAASHLGWKPTDLFLQNTAGWWIRLGLSLSSKVCLRTCPNFDEFKQQEGSKTSPEDTDWLELHAHSRGQVRPAAQFHEFLLASAGHCQKDGQGMNRVTFPFPQKMHGVAQASLP